MKYLRYTKKIYSLLSEILIEMGILHFIWWPCHQGTLGNLWKHFWLSQGGEDEQRSWHLVSGGQGCPGQLPPMKNCPDEAEKP